MIPGINLLSVAFGVIGTSVVPYRKFKERTKNAALQYVNEYEAPFGLAASVQAVKQSVYRQFNLDWQRKYVRLFASMDMIDLDRDTSGDQFVWGGRTFQLQDRSTWFLQDGWCAAMAVDIGPALFDIPPPEANP